MLTGLNLAWFKVYSGAVAECSLAQSTRGRTFGILVGDDKWALRYQLADARKDHAERHLVGPPILSDWSSAEGNVTAQSNREWRQRRAEQKRRAKRLLAPIFEREAELDAMGM